MELQWSLTVVKVPLAKSGTSLISLGVFKVENLFLLCQVSRLPAVLCQHGLSEKLTMSQMASIRVVLLHILNILLNGALLSRLRQPLVAQSPQELPSRARAT